MKNDFETKFTGWAFIIGAIFLLAGQELSPHKLGEYFIASDFENIGKNIWIWIWMYRIYIFGWVIMGLGMIGFASMTFEKELRILTMPGAGIIIIGTFVTSLAAAFYYTYGAWGVGKTEGMSIAEIQMFTDNIIITNHYVTCLVRFGRIFSGVGFVLLGVGLLKFKVMDSWIGIYTALMGITSVCVILFIHDNFEIYKPLFFVKVLWLLIIGTTILRKGINLQEKAS